MKTYIWPSVQQIFSAPIDSSLLIVYIIDGGTGLLFWSEDRI